jgi:DNA replication protein DnaC
MVYKDRFERALKRYANYELLIIDEIGYLLSIAKQEASILFQLNRLKHEVDFIILITNILHSRVNYNKE